MPEYILTHTFVAAVSSPTGNYAMLFFSAVGEELPSKHGSQSLTYLVGFTSDLSARS